MVVDAPGDELRRRAAQPEDAREQRRGPEQALPCSWRVVYGCRSPATVLVVAAIRFIEYSVTPARPSVNPVRARRNSRPTLPLQACIGEGDAQPLDAGELRHLPPEIIGPLDVERPAAEPVHCQREGQEGGARGHLVDAHLSRLVGHQPTIGDAIDDPSISPHRRPKVLVDDVAGLAGVGGFQQFRLDPLALLLTRAQGAQRGLIPPPRLRFQEALPVRDAVTGAQLAPFLGLPRLALGVVAGPLLGEVLEAVATERAAQAGQALLSQSVAVIGPQLPAVGRVSLAQRPRGRLPAGQGRRTLVLECL